MKNKILALILLLISFSGCTRSKSNIDAVDIRYTDGHRTGDIIFAKDSATLLTLLDTCSLFKRYKGLITTPQTYLIRKEALQELSKFIKDNCNTEINQDKMLKDVFFEIGTFSTNSTDWCFDYVEDKSALNYYKKMLKYLTSSKYKEDFSKDLIPAVEFYIKQFQ